MAQMQKVEGEVEVKCSAEKLFEMFAGKQQHIPNICPHRILNVEAHQHDWLNLGTTRTWNCVIDGKSQELVEKMESIDEKNKMISWNIIDRGETMNKHYKTMVTKFQAIAKEGDDGCCLVKLSVEYEKINEDAPEPHRHLHFLLGLFKDLGSHLANAY